MYNVASSYPRAKMDTNSLWQPHRHVYQFYPVVVEGSNLKCFLLLKPGQAFGKWPMSSLQWGQLDTLSMKLTWLHHSLIHTKYTLSMFLNFQCKLHMPPVIPLACSWDLELYSESFDQLNCTWKSAKMAEGNNELVSMCTDVLSMCKVCVEVQLG